MIHYELSKKYKSSKGVKSGIMYKYSKSRSNVKILSTVNSVAVNSVATVNSVAGFSAEQKATELTVESNYVD